MSFTKRDYEAVARIIRTMKEHADSVRSGDTTPNVLRDASGASRSFYAIGSDHGVSAVESNLSAMFAATNERFDAERFARACEPGSGK